MILSSNHLLCTDAAMAGSLGAAVAGGGGCGGSWATSQANFQLGGTALAAESGDPAQERS